MLPLLTSTVVLYGDQHNNNEEEFNSAIDSEDRNKFYLEDEGGEDFLENDLDV